MVREWRDGERVGGWRKELRREGGREIGCIV